MNFQKVNYDLKSIDVTARNFCPKIVRRLLAGEQLLTADVVTNCIHQHLHMLSVYVASCQYVFNQQ